MKSLKEFLQLGLPPRVADLSQYHRKRSDFAADFEHESTGAALNKARFKNNAVWAVVGTAAVVLSQAITLIALARILSPKEFGIVSAATLVNQFALIFAEFGVGAYVVQRAQLSEKLIGSAYLTSCVAGLAIAMLIVGTAPLLAGQLDIPELTSVMQVYSITFLIFGAYAVHDALIQRDLDYPYLARSDATSYLVGYAGVSICCAFLGFSYWSLVIGHISQQAIRCVFLRVRHQNLARYPRCWEEIRHIRYFGFGQTLSRIGSFLAGQADGFVVTSNLGVVAMGHYGRATQLVIMPAAQLGQIFDKLIFPYIARLKDEQSRAAATYLNAVRAISILSIPASAAIWICGKDIVNLLLGSQWTEVVLPLQVLALAIPFRMIHKVSDPTARAMGKTYSRAWRQWVVAISLFCLALILSKYGLVGVAWAASASSVIDAVLMVWLCRKVIDFRITQAMNALLPGIFAGTLVFVAAWSATTFTTLNEGGLFYRLTFIGALYFAIDVFFMRFFLRNMR